MKKEPFSLLKIIVLFFLLVFLFSCNKSREKEFANVNQLKIKSFTPFDQFISNTEKAEYKDYERLPGSRVMNEEEFLKMKNHIINLYKGVKVKNSFVMDSAMFIDCIDINTQPGLRIGEGKYQSIAEAPPAIIVRDTSADSTKARPVKTMLGEGKRDGFGNVMFCDKGYIPMRRITLEEITRFKTLNDFFNKAGVSGSKGIPENQ
jgi:hypothetical protein